MTHELVIDRAIWLQGESNSYLFRSSDRKMCCLGIYLRSLGVAEKDLIDEGAPDNVENSSRWGETWLLTNEHSNSMDAYKLMEVNDEPALSTADRESQIRIGFRKHDVEVTFTGTYPESEETLDDESV